MQYLTKKARIFNTMKSLFSSSFPPPSLPLSPPFPPSPQASRAAGGDDIEDSEDDIVQTLMELDYETLLDDENEDEFSNFKASLQGF